MMETRIDDALMLDYAAGSLAEPVALAVATHLSLHDEARAAYGAVEAIGGAILSDLEEVSLSNGALGAVLDRLDGEAGEPSLRRCELDSATRSIIPAPLQAYIGKSLDSLEWKRRGAGVEEARLAMSGADSYKVALLRIEPGRAMPQHSHCGAEYTVVLQGAYRDGDTEVKSGDFCVADADDTHQPVADPKEGCLCLIVLDEPVRLTGAWGWVINPFLKH